MASKDDSDTEKKPLSKKKARKLARLIVAELKQLVKLSNGPTSQRLTRVSSSSTSTHTTTSFLSRFTGAPSAIFLQGKRGIEKPPFQLPAYIADAGIATMRDALTEKEANVSLKAKTREQVQPKMGKADIDYQKLHDAFCKFQTKPPVTGFGGDVKWFGNGVTCIIDPLPGTMKVKSSRRL